MSYYFNKTLPVSLNFWSIWIAGAMGAALGEWLSYWLGAKIGPTSANVWLLSCRLPGKWVFAASTIDIEISASSPFSLCRAL